MSPQFLLPCPSKLADENPLSPSAFPSALVFEISGQLVWTPFESSSTPLFLPHKYHLPVPSSPLLRRPPPFSRPFAHVILFRIHLKKHYNRRYTLSRVCRRGNHTVPNKTVLLLPIPSLDFSSTLSCNLPRLVAQSMSFCLCMSSWPVLNSIQPIHIPQNFANHLALGSCTQYATTWPSKLHAMSLSKE